MSRSASTSRLGSEFDLFLFARIGEDTSGLSLSVVSALARMDLDPWQEAAALAALPTATATQKVAALLRGLPDDVLREDRDTLATRLIALLPHSGRSGTRTRTASVAAPGAKQRWLVAGTILFTICMLVFLASQLITGRDVSPTPGDASRATPSLAEPRRTAPAPDEAR
jgi:hypothetical protein